MSERSAGELRWFRSFWQCRDRSIDLSSPKIMGIVNVTPDSFSDGGKYYSSAQAIEHGLQLAEEGADILDIGGESTRPGAEEVSVHSELERVIPVIEALSARGLVVSVDTSKPEVMTAAAQVGAQIINDVYALRRDGALEAAEKSGCGVCLMHMQGGTAHNAEESRLTRICCLEVKSFLAEESSGVDGSRSFSGKNRLGSGIRIREDGVTEL